VLTYMKMAKGLTVERRWPTMAVEEKQEFRRGLQSAVSELRYLSQEQMTDLWVCGEFIGDFTANRHQGRSIEACATIYASPTGTDRRLDLLHLSEHFVIGSC
jgi:hypothetical protein